MVGAHGLDKTTWVFVPESVEPRGSIDRMVQGRNATSLARLPRRKRPSCRWQKL